MANLKSAKKRIRIGHRNAQLNKSYKSSIKNLIKKYRQNLKNFLITKEEKTYEFLKLLIRRLYSRIDKAVKKNVFHPNKAARQKSRIVLAFKKISSN